MHKNTKIMEQGIKNRRNDLLMNQTRAEQAVCKVLDYIHIIYIKQYPIKTPRKLFFADIYIPSLRLVIEVDGGYHGTAEQKRKDENRSACIRRMGMHLYRITNRQAYHPKAVLAKLKEYGQRNGVKIR